MKKLTLFLLLLISFLINCDEENPVLPKEPEPQLSQMIAPDLLYTISSVEYYLSIHVDDSQGRENIASVRCDVKLADSEQIIRTYRLVDDGNRGDIIPLDGTYTTEIKADSALAQAGNYRLLFKATDVDGNESEQLTHDLTIIEGEENTAPLISDAIVPLTVFVHDTDFYFISVKVIDPQGADDIEFVKLETYEQTAILPIRLDTLRDDGLNGDQQSQDGIYSMLLSPKFSNEKSGKFSFRFQAMDKTGAASNPIVKIVEVIKLENLPPFIYNLIAPETMKLSTTSTVTVVLKVSVNDQQGLDDVRQVYFNSYLPDGRASSGNPFIMADNGATSVNGDDVAGDGVYSLLIGLPPGTPSGNYTFVFEAVDNSGAKSNQITHVLTVIP